MAYLNPFGETADNYRAYLRSKGWKPTSLIMFGIPYEAWINPVTKNTLLLRAAMQSQRGIDRKSQRKWVKK